MERLSIADLRNVTKPGSRRGQVRYRIVESSGEVADKVTSDWLFGIVNLVVIPRLQKGQTVHVRWSRLNRPGMTPWVEVVPEPVTWDQLPAVSMEGEIGAKDGREILHIIPSGYNSTTRCGLDAEFVGAAVALDAPLEHCPTCWSTEARGLTVLS